MNTIVIGPDGRFQTLKKATAVTSASYAVQSDDTALLCDDTNNHIDVLLPSASSPPTRLTVKKLTQALFNGITVNPLGAQKIDGQSSVVLSGDKSVIRLLSDGSNW